MITPTFFALARLSVVQASLACQGTSGTVPSNSALPSVSCLCVQIPCVLQIVELRGAQAESECKSKALSEELQAAKEALRRRDASLQRNQCDQQVIQLKFPKTCRYTSARCALP